ncbi:MAG: hypothetical protein R6V04_16155 [bacterium]
MKKLFTISVSLLIIVLFVTACATKLSVKEMAVNPSQVSAGDEVVSYVTLNKYSDQVASVKATVREYPEYSFTLNNDGEEGDEEAGDNIWSKKMAIPWNAPAQTYHLDISILDEEGNIIARKKGEEVSERSGTISIEIE